MRESRDSLYEDDEPSTLSRVGVGCGVGCVVLVLAIGALGIVFGARERFAEWQDEEDPAPPVEPDVVADPTGGSILHPGPGPTEPPPRPAGPSMRDRYHPGPFVQVESMVESGRLLGDATFGGAPVARTVDTPWLVPGSELRPQPMPVPTSGGPTVSHDPTERPDQVLPVLPRTPTRVLVRAHDAQGGTAVSGYLVDFVGYPGHFWLPATVPTELGVVQAGGSDGATVYFAIQAPVMSNGVSLQAGQTFRATMRVAAVDAQGRASAPVSRDLEIHAVGAGDVEVTLTMGEATDMDLYVTDPSGVQIYFGNRDAFSGGHLDLDANAACSSNMGVDNEHIYWPAGRAPAGTYVVHVAHYESCISGRAVSYRVTVRACGETVVLTGSFDGRATSQVCRAPTPSDRAWCQEVLRFEMPGCAP
ncbi:MAG: hypothetical protein H6719_32240 [Sandaracinaceae bacterium]|nr:hypothetical protein [Sandaracinaceae bacterium]